MIKIKLNSTLEKFEIYINSIKSFLTNINIFYNVMKTHID